MTTRQPTKAAKAKHRDIDRLAALAGYRCEDCGATHNLTPHDD
jgi:hypothetical protein